MNAVQCMHVCVCVCAAKLMCLEVALVRHFGSTGSEVYIRIHLARKGQQRRETATTIHLDRDPAHDAKRQARPLQEGTGSVRFVSVQELFRQLIRLVRFGSEHISRFDRWVGRENYRAVLCAVFSGTAFSDPSQVSLVLRNRRKR